MSKTNGPKVTVRLSCFDCQHCSSDSYRVQGDSGSSVYCKHSAYAPRYIGDTTWDTPAWCPLRPADPQARIAELEAEVARMQPVYKAALLWRAADRASEKLSESADWTEGDVRAATGAEFDALVELGDVIDAALSGGREG